MVDVNREESELEKSRKAFERDVEKNEKEYDEKKSEEESAAQATEKRNRRKLEQKENDLRDVLSSASGRRFVYRILEEAGVYSDGFNTNAAVMGFHAGKRNMGLFLLKDIEDKFIDQYSQMRREHKSDLLSDAAEKKKNEDQKES